MTKFWAQPIAGIGESSQPIRRDLFLVMKIT